MSVEEIIRQIKYDASEIEHKFNSIRKTREKMKEWQGKPIYNSCVTQIENWNYEIESHKLMLKEFIEKL